MIGQRLTIDRQLGARIRAARVELNLSPAALGALLGIPVDQVHRLEDGDVHISSEQLTEIAAALGKALSYFFHGWLAHPASEHLLTKAGEHEASTVGLQATMLMGNPRRLLPGGGLRRVNQVDRDFDPEPMGRDTRLLQ